MKKKLPRSLRKFIRREKARLGRGNLDLKEKERLINEIYQKFLNQYARSRNIQSSHKDGN